MAKAAQGLVQRLVQRGPELFGGEGRRGGRGSGETTGWAELRGARTGQAERRGWGRGLRAAGLGPRRPRGLPPLGKHRSLRSSFPQPP